MLAVVLPIGALVFTSLQRFATVILSQAQFTLANYQTALSLGPVRTAMGNSLMLGFGVFPQAVPRLAFGLALLLAWFNIPIPIYGTLWLLALAYFTVIVALVILFRLTRGMIKELS